MSCRYFGFCESEGLFVVLVLGVLEVSSPASIDAPAPTEPDCEVLEPMLPLLLELVPIPLFGEELVDEPVVGEVLVDEPVVGEVLVDEVLFGDVLVDDPVVAELSVEVPVVAELSVGDPVVALPLALTPVFGVVAVPERVSSPVVPGVAVPVAPVALPVPVPEPAVPVDVPAVVPPVPPTEPPVPPPVCAGAPAAARAPAARIVPANFPIPISSSFPRRVVTPPPSGNPTEIPRHRNRRSIPRLLVPMPGTSLTEEQSIRSTPMRDRCDRATRRGPVARSGGAGRSPVRRRTRRSFHPAPDDPARAASRGRSPPRGG